MEKTNILDIYEMEFSSIEYIKMHCHKKTNTPIVIILMRFQNKPYKQSSVFNIFIKLHCELYTLILCEIKKDTFLRNQM